MIVEGHQHLILLLGGCLIALDVLQPLEVQHLVGQRLLGELVVVLC